MGLNSMASIYASRGEDYQTAINQRIAESLYIQKQCAAAGIDTTAVQNFSNQPAPTAAVTPPSIPPAQDTTVTPALEAGEATVHLTMAEPEPAPSTETFTMRDDAVYTLTKAEQDMVVSALGIGKYRTKTKKKK